MSYKVSYLFTSINRKKANMQQIIDYTKLKPGDTPSSSMSPLIKCPKCGKTGRLRHYPKDNFDLVIHKMELQSIMWDVTDSCIIKH